MPPGYQHGSQALHGGVPWESSQGGFFGRWWETVTAVNFKGRELFAAVAQSDDPMPACLFSMTTYAMCGFVFMGFFMLIYALIGATLLGGLASAGGKGAGAAFGFAGLGIVMILVVLVGATVVYAIGGFISPWIYGGLHHLGLMIFGGVGNGKGYSDTVRANAYAQAGAFLWIMIPIPYLNSLVSLIFSIINHVIGYDEVHGCGGGKAFLAWVSPFVLCCCCGVAMALASGVLSNM